MPTATFPVEFGGRVFRSSDFAYRGYVSAFPELLTRFSEARRKSEYPTLNQSLSTPEFGELEVAVLDPPQLAPGTLLRFHNVRDPSEYFVFRYKRTRSYATGPLPIFSPIGGGLRKYFLVGDVEFVSLDSWHGNRKIDWVVSYFSTAPRVSPSASSGLGTYHHRQMQAARLAMEIAAPGVGFEYLEDFDRSMFGPGDLVSYNLGEPRVRFPIPSSGSEFSSSVLLQQMGDGTSEPPGEVNFWSSRRLNKMINVGASVQSYFAFRVRSSALNTSFGADSQHFYCGFSNDSVTVPLQDGGFMFRLDSGVNSNRWRFHRNIETEQTYNSSEPAPDGLTWDVLEFTNNAGTCEARVNGTTVASFSITTPDLWVYPIVAMYMVQDSVSVDYSVLVDYVYARYLPV